MQAVHRAFADRQQGWHCTRYATTLESNESKITTFMEKVNALLGKQFECDQHQYQDCSFVLLELITYLENSVQDTI